MIQKLLYKLKFRGQTKNTVVRMMKLYVDDLNQVFKCLEYGSRYYYDRVYILYS